MRRRPGAPIPVRIKGRRAPGSRHHSEEALAVRLTDKTAIVTGAASGIGREIANRFLGEGARVAFADRDIEAARRAAAEADPTGGRAFRGALDGTDQAQEGAAHGVRSNVICPGFVRTPLVDRQIPEQARELGLSEDEVVRTVMLKETVDGEFTTVDDVASCAVFLAGFPTNALTGQSLVVS